MALHSPDALGVQIYKKVGEGFKNFPSKISLALTGNINLAVKQVSVDNGDTPKLWPKSDERSSTAEEEEVGPLSHLLCRLNKSPSPELIQKCAEVDQQCAEEWGLRVGRIAGISPELRQTLESEEMPTRMRERNDVFRQFGLEGRMEYQSFEDLDMKNLPDYDPDQEYDVYEYSSDPRLEPPDAFGLGRLSSAASDSANQSSDVSLPKRGDEFNKEAENPLKAQSAGADAAGEFSASETRTSQQWEFMCSSRAKSHKDFTSDLSFIPNPSTSPLAPSLLIYSINTPPREKDDPKAAFVALLKRYQYLTSDEHYLGFTACRQRDNDVRWLIVQEFRNLGFKGGPGGDLELKKKEARFWWYRNGWRENGVGFYQLEKV